MDNDAFSPDQFCQRHGISRASLYRAIKEGRGPRTFKVGTRTLISREAAAEWRARLGAETAGTAA